MPKNISKSRSAVNTIGLGSKSKNVDSPKKTVSQKKKEKPAKNNNEHKLAVIMPKNTPKSRSYCSLDNYPDSFVLDLNGKRSLDACREHTFRITASSFFNKTLNCDPWADIHARIYELDSDYQMPGRFEMKFNAAKVVYVGNGVFSLSIPALLPGNYLLEVLQVHDESIRETMFSIDIIRWSRCMDKAVKNTPATIKLVDNVLCQRDLKTPLCASTSSFMPGRWLTVPHGKCDGVICEGNIEAFQSERVWVPNKCHFKIFDSNDMNMCLANKNVLIIGDSITREVANAFMQIYMYRKGKKLENSQGLQTLKLLVPRAPPRSYKLGYNTTIRFSFIMAIPLGCGVPCIVKNPNVEKLLIPNGKVDLIIFETGVHDIAPFQRIERVKDYDVFDHYTQMLPLAIDIIQKLVKPDGHMFWINAPDPSDRARCDFMSRPRVKKVNQITESFAHSYMVKDPRIHYIDYFSISESCYCGNIHKGFDYYSISPIGYNGLFLEC
ncbi:uncharacterized protein LOC144363566 [Saccoglossus kowalevskii]